MSYEIKISKEKAREYADMNSEGELQKASETLMCFWMISDALDKVVLNNKWNGENRRQGERRKPCSK